MANEDMLKKMEERLARLETMLAQPGGGFTTPGGTVVDPAPWPGGGGGWHPRWPWPWPWPHPVSDPVPWPHPISDPAPGGGFGGGVFTQGRAGFGTIGGRIGPIGDPAPIDISRFTISQLESSLHSISAEKARLTAMETMLKQQMETLKKQG